MTIHEKDISDTDEWTDLDYMNGWKETPDIVKKCQELDHELDGGQIGNCHYSYYCPICKYSYKIDSSD